MVKIYSKDGIEIKFDSKEVEGGLKKAGLPGRVAEEVAERVKDHVQNGWTSEQVNRETDVELRHLQEDIDRAYLIYKRETPMGEHNVGEQRSPVENDYDPNVQPRCETKVECRNVGS